MAIDFLTCEANAVMKLQLNLSYQCPSGKISRNLITVDTDKVYKIQIADNMTGLRTVNGRIISFTLCSMTDTMSYVSQDTKPVAVDTITIDCSEDGESKVIVANIGDIRYIEEIQTNGFNDISKDNIKTFK